MRWHAAALLLPTLFSPAHAEPIEALFSHTHILPGETLRIEIDKILPGTKSSVRFRERTYPFFVVGPDAQRALIAIPLSTKPGDYPLVIKTGAEAAAPKQTWTLTVEEKKFEIENITLKPETAKLRSTDRKESKRIRAAARHRSVDQYWESFFAPPVEGPIIGVFGLKRMHNGKDHAGFHNGVDLRSPQGTPVKAANAGVVQLAVSFRAHGKTVMVDHGQGVMTIYLHMSKISVRPGQKVKKGETLGLVGSTGVSTAPHVHWQVFVHGVPTDPQAWLDKEM